MGLGTAEIKQLIGGWLSDPAFRQELVSTFIRPGDHDVLARVNASFDLPETASYHELSQRIFDLWKNPETWKRAEKRRIKGDWEDYIDSSNGQYEFASDFAGWQDKDLVTRCGTDQAFAEKCWYRLFEPRGTLGCSFRLEILTTPDDDAVVGWVIFVD